MERVFEEVFVLLFLVGLLVSVFATVFPNMNFAHAQTTPSSSGTVFYQDDFSAPTLDSGWGSWTSNVPVLNTTLVYQGLQSTAPTTQCVSCKDNLVFLHRVVSFGDTAYMEGFFYLSSTSVFNNGGMVLLLGIVGDPNLGNTYVEMGLYQMNNGSLGVANRETRLRYFPLTR